ncbi:pentatricopeptide repeat-containing protein At3g56550-like [Nymphaea colorata]|uniref:pentatricopeptide repeat-containing protein At3g56550-like n=1 Tax=Nymphaea colorata TaxID=210225 RepID=UPI00129D4E11|nr:pentatricopeptide repeat-containing protein At3g56550-like [Nymphaea colorata]
MIENWKGQGLLLVHNFGSENLYRLRGLTTRHGEQEFQANPENRQDRNSSPQPRPQPQPEALDLCPHLLLLHLRLHLPCLSPLPPFFCPLPEQDLGDRIACKNVAVSSSSTPSSSVPICSPDPPPLLRLPFFPREGQRNNRHTEAIDASLQIDGEMLRNFYVCAELIHMYGGLGCIDSARQVFDEMSERNEVVWSLMISKYIHNGYDGEAMSLFSRMRYEEFSFNSFIMVSLIGSSARLIDLSLGSCIHGCVIKKWFGR